MKCSNLKNFSTVRIMFYCLMLSAVLSCSSTSSIGPIQNPSLQQTPMQGKQSFEIMETTIAQIHQAIQSHEISCESLTKKYLDRIQRLDQSSKLNAIIYINPNALVKAKSLDKNFAETNKITSLHCIPVILKDNFDTADMPTEAGSIAMKGSLPPDDAYMVKKLRQAGAIIIAKSNMGEWAFSPYNTISSSHGETANAYDLTRVPAGSSGGTASAIAANFGVIGMGTDTGNSIRGPASHLSLVGMRSTIGLTSRDGIIPLLLNRDIGGPLMRNVTDTARVFTVIAGYDPADPATTDVRDKAPIDYWSNLNTDALHNVRLGVLEELYLTDTTDPAVKELMAKAIEDLRKAGAEVIQPFSIPDFKKLSEATGFCSRFRYDLNNYLASLGKNAPVKSLKEIVDKKLYRKENSGAMDWAMSIDAGVKPDEQTPPCVDVKGDPRRHALLTAVVNAMNENNIDAIIYPSWSNPPRKIGDNDSPHGNNSPVIAPHSGQPAITVPMGYVEDNLPIGLQLLGRPYAEEKLFQYAYAYEQTSKHRKPPKTFSE